MKARTCGLTTYLESKHKLRKEFLKQYVFCLLAEGEFEGMSSPTSMVKRAVSVFAHDLPTVIGELAQMAAEQNGNRIGAAVFGKINDIIGDVGKRGIKAVWADLQEQYNRGVVVNAETAEKRKRK